MMRGVFVALSLLSARTMALGAPFAHASSPLPAATATPSSCADNTAPHICLFDHALGSIKTAHITQETLAQALMPGTPQAAEYQQERLYNTAGFMALIEQIAATGTPAQKERALAFFDLPVDALFIATPAAKGTAAASPPQNLALAAKLLLLSGLNRPQEIIELTKQVERAEAAQGVHSSHPLQRWALRFYAKNHSADDTLALFDALYGQDKHLVIASPSADDPARQYDDVTYIRFLTDLLFAGQFNQARRLTDIFAARGPAEIHADFEKLLAAYARRSADPTAQAYYKDLCTQLFSQLINKEYSFSDYQSNFFDYHYNKRAVRLLDLQCLRDNSTMARQIGDGRDTPDRRHNDMQALNQIEMARHAHTQLLLLEHLSKPLTGIELEHLVMADPYIAADACRARRDEKCIGAVADIIIRKEISRLTPDEPKDTSPSSSNAPMFAPSTGFYGGPPGRPYTNPFGPDRFKGFDINAFQREFGLIPPLPVPAAPPPPAVTQEMIDQAIACLPPQNDATGIRHVSCMGTALYRPMAAQARSAPYLLRQKYMQNPYVDWAAKKTP